MDRRILIPARITGGKLVVPRSGRFRAWVALHEGTDVVVSIEDAREDATDAQVGYYYKYIIPTLRAALHDGGTRMTEDGLDAWLLSNYPGSKWKDVGWVAAYAKDLSKHDFSMFLDWVMEFAAEDLGVVLEDPRQD